MEETVICSVIIPTIGRQSLSRAIESVLTQDLPQNNVEIIIVNDSGHELLQADWQKSDRVQVITTQKRERCFARNAGAAIAKGDYLMFFDDDDWLLPEVFRELYNLTLTKHAGVYYGGYNLVSAEGNLLLGVRPDEEGDCFIRLLIGEWLPIQCAWIKAQSFFDAGGFVPNMIPGEDVELMIKLAISCDFAVTEKPIANLLTIPTSSTFNPESVDNYRLTREHILAMPDIYQRLRLSASKRLLQKNYWKGRVSAIYFASMVWNWKHKKIMKIPSRAFLGIVNILSSGKAVISSEFWRGLNPHRPKGHLNSHDIL
jgi:glycosyltransferase involved in cell wall biosynthesis